MIVGKKTFEQMSYMSYIYSAYTAYRQVSNHWGKCRAARTQRGMSARIALARAARQCPCKQSDTACRCRFGAENVMEMYEELGEEDKKRFGFDLKVSDLKP